MVARRAHNPKAESSRDVLSGEWGKRLTHRIVTPELLVRVQDQTIERAASLKELPEAFLGCYLSLLGPETSRSLRV